MKYLAQLGILRPSTARLSQISRIRRSRLLVLELTSDFENWLTATATAKHHLLSAI